MIFLNFNGDFYEGLFYIFIGELWFCFIWDLGLGSVLVWIFSFWVEGRGVLVSCVRFFLFLFLGGRCYFYLILLWLSLIFIGREIFFI